MSRLEEIKEKEEVAVVEAQVMENEERQTIVHCSCSIECAARIWPSTFLIERGSGRKAKLITAFNIAFAPEWSFVREGQQFTLIFEGLSKECAVFDLKEIIPQEGGFEVVGILRNKTDVYTVTFE